MSLSWWGVGRMFVWSARDIQAMREVFRIGLNHLGGSWKLPRKRCRRGFWDRRWDSRGRSRRSRSPFLSLSTWTVGTVIRVSQLKDKKYALCGPSLWSNHVISNIDECWIAFRAKPWRHLGSFWRIGVEAEQQSSVVLSQWDVRAASEWMYICELPTPLHE